MKDIVHLAAWRLVGRIAQIRNKILFKKQRESGQIVRFNTSMATCNLGDYIIMYYCNDILRGLYPECNFLDVSTHMLPTREEETLVKETKYKFVCGTNLLTSHIEEGWNWRLPDGFRAKLNYRNVILLGVGWKNYEEKCSEYTRMIYRELLNPSVIHSVRDSYTEKKLKQIGINNVINTGCPTMWRLTPEFCETIPTKKARNVITTITDYRPDVENDSVLLNILGRNYETVYLWLQGSTDEEYIKKLELPSNIAIIPARLTAYEEMLSGGNVDYIGTRLHAGIFALNHHVRSIVIAVDNRAKEIAKDTDLPIIPRERIESDLESLLNRRFETEIKIKEHNIDTFMEQFK